MTNVVAVVVVVVVTGVVVVAVVITGVVVAFEWFSASHSHVLYNKHKCGSKPCQAVKT